MATDWTSPKTSDTHINELAATRGRDESNARMDYTGDTNIPDGTIRWNKTNNRFEIWNATTSTWSVLSSKYLINVDTVDGYHAGNASGNVPVSNGTVNTNLNADKLDGQHGTFFQARANHTGTQAPSTISPQGAGSGLNADLLDGLHSSAFLGVSAKAVDSDKLDGLHASDFQAMIDQKVDEFIVPANSNTVIWHKVGELTTDIGSGANNLTLLVSGVSDYGRNKPGVDVVQVSTRYGVSVDVYSLVPPGTRDQTYCYRNNATTGKTEIWVKRDAYTCETHFAVLNVKNATYGNLASSSTEPSGIVYVDIKTHWTSGNDGPGSGLVADMVDGYHAGNASGNVPVSNGTLNINLNADLLDGKHLSEIGGSIWDVIIEDRKPQGTNGGTFTSGAWRTRVLNTLVYNHDSLASLSYNRFTLPAGTYCIDWDAPAYDVAVHRSALYNYTRSTIVAYGTSMRTGSLTSASSNGTTVITITSPTSFEIRHICKITRDTNGFGIATTFGTEIYTRVRIKKIG